MVAEKEERKWAFEAVLADPVELAVGFVLLMISFIMPLLFTVQNLHILDQIHDALYLENPLSLVTAAIRLITLNTVRAAPHYIGSFMIAESLEFRWGKRNLWAVNALMVVGLLQVAYEGVNALHQIHYDFGLPAMLVSGFVIVIDRMDYKYIAKIKKALLIFTGLAAFQFLDIMPAATGLPVGRGETSTNIKLAGNVLGISSVLNALATVGFLLFAGISVLFFIMLRDENKLREMVVLREQNEAIRAQAQFNEMKNRTYQEMQHLVHDLKSPLTVVQTLVGAVKMDCAQKGEEENLALLDRAENAVDQMSQMISEILYEEKASLTTVEQILNRVSAQLSVEDYTSCVEIRAKVPQAQIRVNCVLFPRALVNLVQNSVKAIPEGRKAHIIICSNVEENWVRFRVSDNGKGISKENQGMIWSRGYSGRASSGLGLTFVRSVVERVGGKVELKSRLGEGTTVTLWIPKEGEQHGNESQDHDSMH